MQTYERRNHKLAKLICIGVMAISLIFIGLFIYWNSVANSKKPLIKYPSYELSTKDWTSGDVVITVLNTENISAYSFDGGVNFQDEPEYVVLENGNFNLIVKDINGRLSKAVPISIKNIDKEAPQINFENPTTVQLNSNFNLRTGVVVTENGSGLSNNYVITPDKIDTTTEGTYEVIYTAYDKVGNSTEKTRTIIVKDIIGRTYYRTRTIETKSVQCEPYACNCVVSKEAELNNTCGTGYQFNAPDKCCQTCYKTCRETVYGEWSEWTQEKQNPTSKLEVETKVE